MAKIVDWKDVGIRSMKTAAQAFGGVLVPAVVAYLNGGWPASLDAAWVVLAPTVSAALAAAICAAWNAVLEALKVDAFTGEDE